MIKNILQDQIDSKTQKLRPEILLHPNIPKPLHGMNPRSILGQEWWDKQRRAAYAKEDFHCWACGVHKTDAKYHQWLEGHECYKFNYSAGTAVMIEIVALCHSCHNFIHRGKLAMDLRAGRISQEKHDEILEHGTQILHQLCKVDEHPYIVCDGGTPAKWGDWRLILEGKEYRSKFENFDEWKQFYSRKGGK